MVNRASVITSDNEIPTYVANGFTALSGAHSGQYELAFNGGAIVTSGTIGTTNPPPTDFSQALILVALDVDVLGYYFLEGSHQRLAYFRGDGGGSYEGLAFEMANYPETDSRYNSATRRTVYMPPGWTLI